MSASAVVIVPDSSSGGSHESVWRQFHRALSDRRGVAANGPYLTADKRIIDDQIRLLIDLISRNGQNAAWPSEMRNSIQYRQAEGLWYPYKGKFKTSSLQQEAAALIRGQREFSKIVMSTGSDLEQFRSACAAIICFVRAVIADMSAVSGPKSFLIHGQRRFEDAVTP